jgi:hypothetical protein
MSQPIQPFLETLYHLRTVEHVMLYKGLSAIPYKEEQDVIQFLEAEYERESIDYPYTPPSFSAGAAIWAAKTVYVAAQLFLYRDNKADEMSSLLPPYTKTVDASAILSADLCLRFLPSIKYALETVDVNDPLLPVVEQHLQHFPYSGIGHEGELLILDATVILKNDCLRQLYLDRVTERKAIKWAEEPIIKSAILSNMGNHKHDLWREL